MSTTTSQDIPFAYQDSPIGGTFEAAVSVASPPSRRAITLRKRKGRNRYYLGQLLATSVPMVVADLAGMLVAVALASCAVLPFAAGLGVTQLVSTLAPMLIACFCYCGLYPGVAMGPIAEFKQLIIGTTLAFGLMAVARFTIGFFWFEFAWLSAMWLTLATIAPMFRNGMRSILANRDWWGQPAIILGPAPHSTAVHRKLSEQPSLGLRPVGVVDDLHRQWEDDYAATPYLGPVTDLGGLCQKYRAFWVIAVSDEAAGNVLAGIDRHAPRIPNVVVSPIQNELPSLWARTQEYAGRVGIHFHDRLRSPLQLLIKRMMDVAIVVFGGILILPLLLLVAAAIKICSPGPVFYTAPRIGRGGRRFLAWKFRTMVSNADELLETYLQNHPELRKEWESSHKLKHDPRIIKGVGWFLRKSSLDEMPQLWNVLRGDMSLVGPRPIVTEEVDKYANSYELYCRVLPGMSGLWQVSGRNHTTYERRVELDSYYVRNWSPWLDLYILVKTIRTVLLCEGAY